MEKKKYRCHRRADSIENSASRIMEWRAKCMHNRSADRHPLPSTSSRSPSLLLLPPFHSTVHVQVCMCMCVCVCACVLVCLYAYVYTCVFLYACVCVCILLRVQCACMCVYLYECVCACMWSALVNIPLSCVLFFPYYHRLFFCCSKLAVSRLQCDTMFKPKVKDSLGNQSQEQKQCFPLPVIILISTSSTGCYTGNIPCTENNKANLQSWFERQFKSSLTVNNLLTYYWHYTNKKIRCGTEI